MSVDLNDSERGASGAAPASQPIDLRMASLTDGRQVYCVNTYEVDFSWHEIFSEDLTAHGIVLPEDGAYIDVGANIGLFALYLSDHCPKARLFAYEPMPASYAALVRNIEGMGARARAFQMALGAGPGVLEFDYFPAITALSTANVDVGAIMSGGLRNILFGNGVSPAIREILDRTGASARLDDTAFTENLFRKERVNAPVDTLSHQMALHGLDHIDLLKVDTEGAEKDVLAGIDEDTWPRIRQLLVEVHIGFEETQTMMADLERRGYRCTTGQHPLAEGGAPVFHIYAAQR